ncbi:MAG: hypothetical protein Q8R46_09045 [Nitrosomonas sp.]|nr:hypothetical protein [Nitrosomonas sp.]MDP1550243.1 hypothetical protein [Nitrosomonas sp.]MDP3663538.1 hypothetical protein [Nitrosomonas sp.]
MRIGPVGIAAIDPAEIAGNTGRDGRRCIACAIESTEIFRRNVRHGRSRD